MYGLCCQPGLRIALPLVQCSSDRRVPETRDHGLQRLLAKVLPGKRTLVAGTRDRQWRWAQMMSRMPRSQNAFRQYTAANNQFDFIVLQV